MWSNSALLLLALVPQLALASADVCPVQPNDPLRFVDVFDGPATDSATLVPDKSGETKGYWLVKYVYDQGRTVTVRCKYAGGTTHDVTLSTKVVKCSYRISKDKVLRLTCK